MTSGPGSWRQWPAASAMPRLSPGTIHVLAFSLDVVDETGRELADTLSAPERARAQRFVHPVHARRYIAGRAVLRSVLSSVLRCRPRDVPLEAPPGRKPRLAGESAAQFNLSHSRDLALIALSTGRAVGVDLEHHESRIEWRAVARTFLADEEYYEIERLGRDQQLPAFYACWSRREAILKARGDGLSGTHEPLPVPDSSWWVGDLPVGPGIAASVASEAPRANLELYRWSNS